MKSSASPRLMMTTATVIVLALACVTGSQADSVTVKAADNSVAAEQASFRLHQDFAVNLFADESMGIANPIAMHWDNRGRLWLLTTLAYAQLAPGEKTDDKIFILQDTDGDGRADSVKVFADGLNMPIGFALGDGGVWVGEGDKLLFLADRDGDDVADGREIVLRGFGTGDTHQNISNFTWGPDACLYFSQGLHTYSRVETPWGIVRGDSAGFFRFDPRELRLEPFCFPSMASQNPCGIAFDKRGAMFLKSNNKELIFVTPGLVPTTHPRNLEAVATLGATPGKSMGGEYVDSAHLPDWLQNHVLIAGYYANRVTAFPLVEDGSGYAPVQPVQLLAAEHTSFRPVDIRLGPDGAIYVADWFNPIIGHYQASLRHPDRDKQHGRIWRLTAKGRPLLEEMSEELKREPWKLDPEFTDQQSRLLESDFSELQPFERLQKVIALANRPEPDSLRRAMHALDHQPDRFIDYALRQAVHALSKSWLAAGESEDRQCDSPAHLAFVLDEHGGPEVINLARAALANPKLSSAERGRFAAVLAKFGTARDILELLDDGGGEGGGAELVFAALANSRLIGPLSANQVFVERLGQAIRGGSDVEKISAVRVAGRWGIARALLADVVEAELVRKESSPLGAEILIAYARIGSKSSLADLRRIARASENSPERRRDAVTAMAFSDVDAAATEARPILVSPDADDALIASVLSGVLDKKGGAAALLRSLSQAKPDALPAGRIAQALAAMGRMDEPLGALLNSAMGLAQIAQDYSAERVAMVSTDATKNGDAKAGKLVFQRAELTCVACHQLGGVGGILGPSLDTVGAGLPIDLIIESVLWPQRQLKEGYFAVGVTTKEGTVLTGYQESEQAGILRLKDPATLQVHALPLTQIAEKNNIGSLMPSGLTASLKPEELRDLIAYLTTLKGE